MLKGDNNSFIDAEQPTEEQIVGSLWVTAPAVGRVAEWLREPLHSALLVGLVDADRARRRHRRRRRASPAAPPAAAAAASPGSAPASRAPDPRGAEAASDRARRRSRCVRRASRSSRSGARSTTTETVEAAYAHQGRFEYEARVPKTAAYPDGHVSTGEPVFQRLVPRLRLTFTYGLDSERPVTADGTDRAWTRGSATAAAGSGRCRWRPARPFARRRATVSGVLDLERAAADHRRGSESDRLGPDRLHGRDPAARRRHRPGRRRGGRRDLCARAHLRRR